MRIFLARAFLGFFWAMILATQISAQNLSILDEKIINLIGETSYNRNKSFINKIFSPKEGFYQSGNLDIYRVLATLQNNGLLKLKFASPREFNAIFTAQASPILLLKAINQSLSNMAYSYSIPSEAAYKDEISTIRISLMTEHIIDPLILLNELRKSGFVVVNITQNAQNEWEYSLALADSKIPNATFLAKGNSISITEVSGQYWLEVGTLGRLEVQSANNRSFHPKIVFFDRNLNILDIQELSRRRDFNISIIENTKFIKISDKILSSNLKGGLNVRLR